jgi:hypothetical protein
LKDFKNVEGKLPLIFHNAKHISCSMDLANKLLKDIFHDPNMAKIESVAEQREYCDLASRFYFGNDPV